MVRIITCWCLARYTQWVLLPPGGGGEGPPPPVPPEAEVSSCLLLVWFVRVWIGLPLLDVLWFWVSGRMGLWWVSCTCKCHVAGGLLVMLFSLLCAARTVHPHPSGGHLAAYTTWPCATRG
jgi:hypothetical protein